MKYHITVPALIVGPDDLVRADGVVMGRLVTENDVKYIEVKDRDRLRSEQRGTPLVRVPAVAFTILSNGGNECL